MFKLHLFPTSPKVLVPPQYKYKKTLLREAHFRRELFSVPMSSKYGYDLDVLEQRVWPLIRCFNQVLIAYFAS